MVPGAHLDNKALLAVQALMVSGGTVPLASLTHEPVCTQIVSVFSYIHVTITRSELH